MKNREPYSGPVGDEHDKWLESQRKRADREQRARERVAIYEAGYKDRLAKRLKKQG